MVEIQEITTVQQRIQGVCRRQFDDRLGEVTALRLTADDMVALANEVLAGATLIVPLDENSGTVGSAVVDMYINPVTREVISIKRGVESRALVGFPSSLAWTDRKHSHRRPAKRAHVVMEWVNV